MLRARLLEEDFKTADGDMDEQPSFFEDNMTPQLSPFEIIAVGSAAVIVVALVAYKLSHKFRKPSTNTADPLLPTTSRR